MNMNLKPKHVLLAIVVTALISCIITASLVLSTTTTSTFYISGGIYPGAPSYTVWFEADGNYYAKDANGLIAFYGTNASAIVSQAMGNLLALGDVGGSIFLIGSPIPLALVLNYVANNTHLEGIGEVQITSTNDGVDAFIMRESATLTNIYLKHNNETIHYYYEWSPELALLHDWTDFPSNGGNLTGTPYMIWDGVINTEGAGEIITPYLRFYPTETNPGNFTFALRPSSYGELLFYDIATDKQFQVHGQASVSGAVNEIEVSYPHGYILASNVSSICITAQQSGQGSYWAKNWDNDSLTIGFANQPGGSTWYFFYNVYAGM